MTIKDLHIYNIMIKGALCLLTLCLWSCQDEWEVSQVEEGIPATVTVQVDLSEMSKLTRANNMSTELENRVNNLWIGIYSMTSGKRLGAKYFDEKDIETGLPGDFPEPKSGKVELEAQSGECYIVAVANSTNKEAIALDTETNTSVTASFRQLLDEADTWDKYRSIILKRDFKDYAVIDAPTIELANGLAMVGFYRPANHVHTFKDDEPVPVTIKPGRNELTGKIHLRRPWTQNTINFEATGNIIDMEIIEMEIINLPEFSWLQSRSQGATANASHRLEYANAGDALSPTPAMPHPNYWNSLKINQSSMDMTTNGNNTRYTYSFWQFENKRTGTAQKYEDRERELKNTNPQTNTGLYKALCPDGKLSLDNNATYIRFKAVITYKDKPSNNTNLPDEDFSDVTTRTAEGTYVVHLGYIGEDATDFNCYRNAKYTYNITIKSAEKILVEAFTDEQQPGAEGEVNDVTDKYYQLDCHFNVFNIYLTKEELNNFTFTLRTYENNVAHEIKYIKKEDKVEHNVPDRNSPDWKYYSWIQLVRNDNIAPRKNGTWQYDDFNKYPIAPYPGASSSSIIYLKDIAEKGSSLFGLGNNDKGQGITVYVKEYTYETDYGQKGYGDETGDIWTGYVNQPDRTAHFNVSFSESADKESIYYKSKYALAQKSIQTYYDVSQASGDGSKASTALGIEHENEVFGMNLRWINAVGNLNSDNGRYNTFLGYGGKSGVSWSNVLDLNNLQSINRIDNAEQTRLAYHISTDARICPVPKTVQITSGLNSGNSGKYNGTASAKYDPQSSNAQFIYALNACMNRNRDENGNGLIDNAELKWYVPASGKYLRMILGRNSLKTPLMNYEQETLPDGCGDDANTLYHFIASDNKIIWVDEGASSSVFYGGGNWSHAPWQVRCIRNLGTNLNDIINEERVIPAYDATDIDNTTHGGVIKVTRYHGSALREPQNDPLPMHKTDAPYNRISRYGFEIAPRGNSFDGSYDTEETPFINSAPGNNTAYSNYADAVRNGTFCETLNKNSGRKGWRIPNQKEIIIIMRTGVLGYSSSDFCYATCTQEHWANYGTPGSSALALNWQYRITTVDVAARIGTALATGKGIKGLRCVRDLTPAEANMSYSEIVNYKQP
ncbi:MAG: hypothetical protein J6K41_10285 [Paraprevotella sp.]|nr:hypothetical protein [Paraprevotella sp.]